jgi:hypothetical protein
MAKLEDPPPEVTTDPPSVDPVSGGIERELFGMWTILLRNVGGFTAVITACVIAVFNAFTTYQSVKSGGQWPSEMSLFITNIGPVIVGWTFMNSSKTISTIMQVKGVTDRLRNSLSTALATKDKTDPPPPQQA